MKLNIDPRLDRGDGKNMCQDIQELKKLQSIRSYPIEAGTKLQIWAMFRGMKKGLYCLGCHTLQEKPPSQPVMGHRCQNCTYPVMQTYPKKLIDALSLGSTKIQMYLKNSLTECKVNVVIGEDEEEMEVIYYDKNLHPFAKADGFKTNKAFIDFFWKHGKIHKDWKTFYINYWKPDSAGQEEGD